MQNKQVEQFRNCKRIERILYSAIALHCTCNTRIPDACNCMESKAFCHRKKFLKVEQLDKNMNGGFSQSGRCMKEII